MTVATTSPVESSARTASPERAAWCPTTCASLKDACSQFWTAKRCRITPAAAWTTPSTARRTQKRTSASCCALDDSLLDRLADRVRHQRLGDHPDDPEGDRDHERPELVAPDPDEQPERGAGVRSPRIGDRELDHGRTRGLYAMRCGSSASGAARLGDPGGVLAPGALEPGRLRVALEGEDVRRDPVEEPAVVGDHDGAAGEVDERILERAERVDVEVVRRLVEEEHVAARLEQLGEVDAVPLSAREVLDELLLVAAAEVEPRRVLARVHLSLAEQDDVLVLGDLLPHRVLRVEAAARLIDVGELRPCRRPGARRRRAAPRPRSSGRASSCRRRSGRSHRRCRPEAAKTSGPRRAAGRRSPSRRARPRRRGRRAAARQGCGSRRPRA